MIIKTINGNRQNFRRRIPIIIGHRIGKGIDQIAVAVIQTFVGHIGIAAVAVQRERAVAALTVAG